MWKPLNTVIQKVWPPSREKTKKQEFLDRLKGLSEIRIKSGLPVGVTFVVTNEGTGHVDNYFLMGPNEWISWGTTPKPGEAVTRQFTSRELEIYLSDEMRNAKPNGKITVLDESCCVVFDK